MADKKIPFEKLTAREVMRTEILTVAVSTPLSDVERLLGEYRIGGLPVTDEAGHIAGVISMRDLVEQYSQDPDSRPRRKGSFYHLSSEELLEEDFGSFDVPQESEETAGDLMTAQVYSTSPDAKLASIAKQMVELSVHRILVVEGTKTLGIISTMDIMRALAKA